ncbi:MAG: type IV toxin-antitoxin system AbiEi family antitoxin [Snowella sp.]
MQPTHPILQKCLKQIELLPNLKAEVSTIPYVSKTILADGQLILHTPQATVEYICEIKSHITRETINNVIEYFTHFRERLDTSQKPLLITENLSNQSVEDLLKKDIEFIDVTGNIYLNSSSFYLLVRRPYLLVKNSLKDSYKITNSVSKIIFALLNSPKILQSSYYIDELIKITKMSKLSIKIALHKLHDLNYIKKKGEEYQILDYLKLLERWELVYTETLRSQLFIDTFTPINNLAFTKISDLLIQKANDWDYLIGGELGAALATNYLHPITATLHVPKNYTQIFVDLKLKPSSTGEITFLKKYTIHDDAWKNNGNAKNSNLADPLLIHAELMMSKDERLRETADIIFNKYIKPRIYAFI